MPVTKTEIDVAQEVINLLVGDKTEAEAYSQDPEGWLDGHGYGDVSPEALATCGTGGGSGGSSGGGGGAAGGGGAGASGYAYAAPPPPDAGAVAQLDYIVYNNYYTDNSVDNSITNNIENHGNLDFTQQVGDGNVAVGDVGGDFSGQVQTGDGVQVGGNVDDSNLNTGEGDQLVDESTNVNAALSYGGDAQAAQAGVGDATNTSGDGGGEGDPID